LQRWLRLDAVKAMPAGEPRLEFDQAILRVVISAAVLAYVGWYVLRDSLVVLSTLFGALTSGPRASPVGTCHDLGRRGPNGPPDYEGRGVGRGHTLMFPRQRSGATPIAAIRETDPRLITPQRAEPIWRKLGIAHSVHDVAVAAIGLNRSRVDAVVGKVEAGCVPQHMRVYGQADTCVLA
jgi:hypothetical protein